MWSSTDGSRGSLADVVVKARRERTEHGLVPGGDGWFVVHARDARWFESDGMGAYTSFEPGWSTSSSAQATVRASWLRSERAEWDAVSATR
jgi:hypothetical protein